MSGEISVLHVDDEPNYAEATAEYLEHKFDRLSVETATNPIEGLDHLENKNIDCVVSDYKMPNQDGIEFLQTVRRKCPDLPFVLFTGKGDEEVASEAIAAGVTDYLPKQPGSEQYSVLANRIQSAVDKWRVEQELEETRDFFRKLVEQNFVGIYIIQDEEFKYVNPKLAEIHEYERDTLIGTSPLDLVAPEERELVKRNLRQRIEGEVDDIHYRTVGLKKGGDRIDIELHGSRITYNGDPAVMGAELDITERMEKERQIEQRNDQLEDFARTISHDLRNPLNVAQMRLELMDDNNEHLETIDENLVHIEDQIDDLLDRAVAGEVVGDLETVEMASLCNRCWDSVATDSASLQVKLTDMIHADSAQLQHLLENLFRNAIEHGGKDVAVEVAKLDEEVGFYVADNGTGIPDTKREKVIESGFSTTEEGTGFGLDIVSKVAEAHGWNLRVTEGHEGGARFEFTDVEFNSSP